jgi:hypothetical protein
MIALLAASALIAGSLVNWAGETRVPAIDIAQPPMAAPSVPAVVPFSEPPPPPAPREPTALPDTDDKGFVHSTARCQGTQTAVALGRTARSHVVICGDTAGRYEYLGVRLSDDAVLKTAAETAPTRGFIARHAGVVYAVTATELLVTTGDTVIKREPMLEFRDINAAGARWGR